MQRPNYERSKIKESLKNQPATVDLIKSPMRQSFLNGSQSDLRGIKNRLFAARHCNWDGFAAHEVDKTEKKRQNKTTKIYIAFIS